MVKPCVPAAVAVARHPAQTVLLSTGVTLTSAMMQGRAILTCWRFGTRTCSVSNDASHNHNGNNGGNHAASTPFPPPRIIWVTHYGISVCHGKPPHLPSLKNSLIGNRAPARWDQRKQRAGTYASVARHGDAIKPR